MTSVLGKAFKASKTNIINTFAMRQHPFYVIPGFIQPAAINTLIHQPSRLLSNCSAVSGLSSNLTVTDLKKEASVFNDSEEPKSLMDKATTAFGFSFRNEYYRLGVLTKLTEALRKNPKHQFILGSTFSDASEDAYCSIEGNALHYAAHLGRRDIAEAALKAGIDINSTYFGRNGQENALSAVVRGSKSIDMLNYLMQHNIDPSNVATYSIDNCLVSGADKKVTKKIDEYRQAYNQAIVDGKPLQVKENLGCSR